MVINPRYHQNCTHLEKREKCPGILNHWGSISNLGMAADCPFWNREKPPRTTKRRHRAAAETVLRCKSCRRIFRTLRGYNRHNCRKEGSK